MKVRALGEGFFKIPGALVGRRVKAGEEFEIASLDQFSSKWMEPLDFDPDGEKPKKKKKSKPAPKEEPKPEPEPELEEEPAAPQDEDVI